MKLKRALTVVLAILLLCQPALAESKLVLPARVNTIGERAFYNDRSIEKAVLPVGIARIESEAFGNSSLKEINLPGTLTYIADDAFDGCSDLTVTVAPNSYALVWCRAHEGIAYIVGDSEELTTGSLSGVVMSAGADGTQLRGMTVTLILDGQVVRTTTTVSDGSYSFDNLPANDYRLVISGDGFITFEGYASVHGGENTYMETSLMVSGEADQTGFAAGTITDAFTGSPLANVNLQARSGWNNASTGTVVARGVTDSAGHYSLELPVGNYTLMASRNGYAVGSVNIVVQPKQTTSNQDLAITPAAAEDEYRIKLTWGQNPRDLDSHVSGKTAAGGAYHVYYGNKNAYDGSEIACNLDVDDTTSYGPEVITLKADSIQPYYYYVHHFSGEGTLGTSGARVEVYRGSALVRTFNVSSDQGSGIYWNVFAIINGKLVSKCTITANPDISYLNGGEEEGDGQLTWSDGSSVREEVDVPFKGDLYSRSIYSAKPWTLTAPNWISVSAYSGAATEANRPASLMIQVAANKSGTREGDLVISAQGCTPLVVHFRQEAADGALLLEADYGSADGEGYTHAGLDLSVKDPDPQRSFEAKAVKLTTSFTGNLHSDELGRSVVVSSLREDMPFSMDFKLYCNPTQRQHEQLYQSGLLVTETPAMTVDITSENCGSYQYKAKFDAYPITTEEDGFTEFLAWNIVNRSSYMYDVYNYKLPCRLLIEPLMNDAAFQAFLAGWRASTFSVSSELGYSEKELNYYRGYVYNLLYGQDEDEGFLDTMADASALLNAFNKYRTDVEGYATVLSNLDFSLMSKAEVGAMKTQMGNFFKSITSANKAGKLSPENAKFLPAAKLYESYSALSDGFDIAGSVMNYLDRVTQVIHFSQLTDEKRALLDSLSARAADRPALAAAIAEYRDIYPALNPALVSAIMAGEESFSFLARQGAKLANGIVVAALPAFAAGQAGGKLLADIAFNTSDIVNAYYECEAAIFFDDGLLDTVKRAESSFVHSPSDETAARFISAVEGFYKNRADSMQAADKYAKAVLEESDTLKFLTGESNVPEETLMRAISKFIGKDDGDSDYDNPAYAEAHHCIEQDKLHNRDQVANSRQAAIAGYYTDSLLVLKDESFTKLK